MHGQSRARAGESRAAACNTTAPGRICRTNRARDTTTCFRTGAARPPPVEKTLTISRRQPAGRGPRCAVSRQPSAGREGGARREPLARRAHVHARALGSREDDVLDRAPHGFAGRAERQDTVVGRSLGGKNPSGLLIATVAWRSRRDDHPPRRAGRSTPRSTRGAPSRARAIDLLAQVRAVGGDRERRLDPRGRDRSSSGGRVLGRRGGLLALAVPSL